jgi:predicted ArsR family transcriptional regulator
LPPLSPTHRSLLRLAARPDGVLVADAADTLNLTRQNANKHLRDLERASLLTAELVDGGRLRYTATADGQTEADRNAIRDGAAVR